MDVQGTLFHHQQYGPPVVLTYMVYPSPFLAVDLQGVYVILFTFVKCFL
jgi:hypothetical protein